MFTAAEPVLIQAFLAEEIRETSDAVPVDQIILYPNKPIPVLMLPKGDFKIRATDKTGQVFAEYLQ